MEKYLFTVRIGKHYFYREKCLEDFSEEALEDCAIEIKDFFIADFTISSGIKSYRQLPEIDYWYKKVDL